MSHSRMGSFTAPFRALVLVFAFVLGSGSARADEESDRARAEAVFLEGQKLFDAGRIEQACVKFEESLAILRTAGALVNLARCHAAQGRTATAWREYTESAELARAAGQEDRAKRAKELADELEPSLSKLTISVPGDAPDGLAVSRNGEPVPASELGVAVPVDPGTYRIVARVPDKDAWETSVQVKPEGDRVVVEVALPSGDGASAPPSASTPPTGPVAPEGPSGDSGGWTSMQVGGVVALGVGVASGVVGAILGGVTMSSVSDAEEDDALCGADRLCTQAGLDQIDSARTTGIVSTVLLGVGVAGVGAGIVLLAIGGDAEGEAQASLRALPGGAALRVRF